jgi:hypothetical protein
MDSTVNPHRPNNGPVDLSKHHTRIGPGIWSLRGQRAISEKSSQLGMMQTPSGLDTKGGRSTAESQTSPASGENVSPGGRAQYDGRRAEDSSNTSPATAAVIENKSNGGSGNESFGKDQTVNRG